MKKEDFASSPTGTLVRTAEGPWAFVPHPLPPDLGNITPLLALASKAERFFGRLDNAMQGSLGADLLLYPLQSSEATASSAMEGTYTSFEALAMEEHDTPRAGGKQPEWQAAREVRNYRQALEHGIKSDLPVCVRLIRDMHAILLRSLPGHRAGGSPGHIRDRQNWIGDQRAGLAGAHFVPPPPQEAKAALNRLEKHLHSSDFALLPPLMQCALIHYQFETIHPFADGNGRIGRILIPLILKKKRILENAFFYMSPWLERHKAEYVNRMQEVRKNGDWTGWLQFFLTGVVETCQETLVFIEKMRNLRADWLSRVSHARASLLNQVLADHLFRRQIVTAPDLAVLLKITLPPTYKIIQRFVGAGILTELSISKRPRYYAAKEILSLLEDARAGQFRSEAQDLAKISG